MRTVSRAEATVGRRIGAIAVTAVVALASAALGRHPAQATTPVVDAAAAAAAAASAAAVDASTVTAAWPANLTVDWNERCRANSCDACLSVPGCGWCPSTWTCTHGDETGPLHWGDGVWAPVECKKHYINKRVTAPWLFSSSPPPPANETNPKCTYALGTDVQHPQWPRLPVEYDHVCKNGGQRMWNWDHWRGNAFCQCPDGWTGRECSLCTATESCPQHTNPAVNTTCARNLVPYGGEELMQKQFTCKCSGPAALLCDFYTPELAGSARVTFDYNMSGQTGVVAMWTPVIYRLPDTFQSGIAFWGNVSQCVLSERVTCPQGDMYDWHGDAPCLSLTCQVDRMFGPAPLGHDCRFNANVNKTSWRYRECPTYIDGVQDVKFVCQYSAGNWSGSYDCAFETGGFGPFALECDTGTCVHEPVPAPPPPPPVPDVPHGLSRDAWYAIILATPAALAVVFFASCALLLCSRRRELIQLSQQDDVKRRRTGSDAVAMLHGASSSSDAMRLDGVVDAHNTGGGGGGGAALLSPDALLDEELLSGDASSGALAGRRREASGGLRLRARTASDEAPLARRVRAGTDDSLVYEPPTPLSFADDAGSDAAASALAGASPDGRTVSSASTHDSAAANSSSSLVFSFAGVEYTLHKPHRRKVLQGVSGVVRATQMFAILGASGAGKSSLLDILAGRKSTSGGTFAGSIRLDGVELTPEQLRRTVAYVTQDDVIMATQTVREFLLFQARLRLPSRVPLSERLARVDKVIGLLGLRHVADTKVGGEFVRGISGGEKRRVSIASELLTDAQLLLLDECTSGLDSASAKAVVDALAHVASSGRIVVMSIHQPRSYIWGKFDGVLLLGAGARVLYTGPRADVVSHFGALGHHCPSGYNPADYLLDVAASAGNDELERLASACPGVGADADDGAAAAVGVVGGGGGVGVGGGRVAVVRAPMRVEPAPGRSGSARHTHEPTDVVALHYKESASWFRQVLELSLRTSMNTVRNPYLLLLNYVATIGVAVGVAVVFRDLKFDFYGLQDRLGFMFFSFLFFGMTSLSSLGVWREERLLFLRERAMGTYSTSAYFVAKVTCELLPLRVLPPVLYTAIVYWQIGLQDTPLELARFTVVIVMVNVLCATLFLAVGAAVASSALANLIASALLLYELLLCGLPSHNVASADDEGHTSLMYVLQKASFLNYAFEILANNEFLGVTYNLSPRLPGGQTPPVFPATGLTIIGTFGLSTDHMARDMWMLFVFFAAALALVFAVLKFVVREKR